MKIKNGFVSNSSSSSFIVSKDKLTDEQLYSIRNFNAVAETNNWVRDGVELEDGIISTDNDIRFYIIGSYKECPIQAAVIQHEIAHALYSLDEDYAYHSDVTCAVIPFRDEIIEVLKEWGYSDAVIKDEVQAYVRTNCKGDWESFPKVNIEDEDFRGCLKSLQIVFNNVCKKYGIEVPLMPVDSIVTKLEEEYKKKYGYNAGEMI